MSCSSSTTKILALLRDGLSARGESNNDGTVKEALGLGCITAGRAEFMPLHAAPGDGRTPLPALMSCLSLCDLSKDSASSAVKFGIKRRGRRGKNRNFKIEGHCWVAGPVSSRRLGTRRSFPSASDVTFRRHRTKIGQFHVNSLLEHIKPAC